MYVTAYLPVFRTGCFVSEPYLSLSSTMYPLYPFIGTFSYLIAFIQVHCAVEKWEGVESRVGRPSKLKIEIAPRPPDLTNWGERRYT